MFIYLKNTGYYKYVIYIDLSKSEIIICYRMSFCEHKKWKHEGVNNGDQKKPLQKYISLNAFSAS